MIIVKLQGGLGNQMFQYAFGLALSRRTGRPLRFDRRFLDSRGIKSKHFVFRTYDLDIFPLECPLVSAWDCLRAGLFFNFSYTPVESFIRRVNYRLNPRIFVQKEIWEPNLPLHRIDYFDGYWQSHKYFEDMPDVIREVFQVRPELHSADVLALAEEIRARPSVCVNVRALDFRTSPGHKFIGREFFEKALAYLRPRLPAGYRVYVFSDDLEWCRENFRWEHPTTLVEHALAGPKFASYLHLMTQCRYFAIPNSSFAWWAAWLAAAPEKVIIVPADMSADPNLDHTYYTPPEWIRL